MSINNYNRAGARQAAIAISIAADNFETFTFSSLMAGENPGVWALETQGGNFLVFTHSKNGIYAAYATPEGLLLRDFNNDCDSAQELEWALSSWDSVPFEWALGVYTNETRLSDDAIIGVVPKNVGGCLSGQANAFSKWFYAPRASAEQIAAIETLREEMDSPEIAVMAFLSKTIEMGEFPFRVPYSEQLEYVSNYSVLFATEYSVVRNYIEVYD